MKKYFLIILSFFYVFINVNAQKNSFYPAGTQNNSKLRLKEVGIKSISGVQGDQLVNIKIAIPKNLTEEQIKHIQYLKDTGI